MADEQPKSIFDPLFNPPATPTQEQELAMRRTEFANGLAKAAAELNVAIVNGRNQLFEAFWGTAANLTPSQKLAAVRAAGYSPEQIFENDAALVAFLAQRFKLAGYTDEQIASKLPGIPPQFAITRDGEGKLVISDAE